MYFFYQKVGFYVLPSPFYTICAILIFFDDIIFGEPYGLSTVEVIQLKYHCTLTIYLVEMIKCWGLSVYIKNKAMYIRPKIFNQKPQIEAANHS